MHTSHDHSWTGPQKWAFRFITSYLLLVVLPVSIQPLIQWLGELILSDPSILNGSGQYHALYSSLHLLTEVFLALFFTMLWSVVDRNRSHYSVLSYWVQLALRGFLFLYMMVYGFAKIYMVQFGFPTLSALLQPLGELTPMGLAWNFMGFSSAYQFFGGFLEVLGGFFLLFRRTTTLGALLIAGVMSNVALMNFGYNIPVKILSVQIVVLSLGLISFDYRRVLSFFFLNEAIDPVTVSPPVKWGWYQKLPGFISKGIAVVVVSLLLVSPIVLHAVPFFNPEKPKLYGMYEVRKFERNGVESPPLITNKSQWHYFVVDLNNRASIKYLDGQSRDFIAVVDTAAKSLRLNPSLQGSASLLPSYSYTYQDDQLTLSRITHTDSLKITLSRIQPEKRFALMQ